MQIHENIDHERLMWRLQRCGWVLMLVVVLAAVAGAFGSGPVSSAAVAANDGRLRVEYERFGRLAAPMQLRIHFPAGTAGAKEVRLSINRSYLERMTVEGIEPEPQSTKLDADGNVYSFPAAPGAQVQVTFRFRPERPGALRGTIAAGTEPVDFQQFIYP